VGLEPTTLSGAVFETAVYTIPPSDHKLKIGGQEGTRTLTLLEHDPKSCASANSATCPHKLFSLRMAVWTQKL